MKHDSVKSGEPPIGGSVDDAVNNPANSSVDGFVDSYLLNEALNSTTANEAVVTPQASEKDTLKAIRHKALDLLARREHSQIELQRKLLKRYNDYALVEQVLERLRSENLQSEQRFTESYVKYRTEAGFGPLRLRQELRERGVSDSLLNEYIQPNSEHWFLVAQQVKRKKFGDEIAVDLKQKAKQLRFMQHRGFGREHINSAHVDSALNDMSGCEEPA